MSRSLSTWSGVEANAHAYWQIIYTMADLPTTQIYHSATPSGAIGGIIDSTTAIGPELDWRSGLGTWSPVAVLVLNGFDSTLGSSGDNTFEEFQDIWDWGTSGSLRIPHLLNTAGQTTISIGAGSSTPTNAIQIFEGYLRDIGQSDFGGLRYEIGQKRELYANKPFLSRLFLEASGDANFDVRAAAVRNPPNEDEKGAPVPILYGQLTYAESIAPHIVPAYDVVNDHHGMVLCFSDNRFPCYSKATSASADEVQLYVPGQNGDPMPVERTDFDGDIQYETLTTSDIDDIGGSSTPTQGIFVGFTDDTRDTDGEGLAAGGNFLVSRSVPLTEVSWNTLDFSGATTSHLGGDPATSVDETSTTTSIVDFTVESASDLEFSRQFYRVFLRIKFGLSAASIETWTPTAGQRGGTLTDQDIGTDIQTPGSGGVYDNWTGSDDPLDMGFEADSLNGFTSVGDGLSFKLQSNSGIGSGNVVSVYGGQVDIWYEIPWAQYWRRIFGACTGVDTANFTGHGLTLNSTNYLTNPAEIFAHFVLEVLGGEIDATATQAASDDMDNHGIRLDFQLTDYGETGQDVLERIANQSMSWIVPNDDGEEVIIYRPTLEGTNARASAPFDVSNIIAGSFNWSLTPREDVYKGVLLNYKWNALSGRYEDQMVIAPTAGPHVTNVTTDASTYTGFVDTIASVNARPLEIDADMVQDDATAERLCKWLTLLHGRRRQVIEFDTFMEHADVTAGDVIYVNMPQVRSYASGDALDISYGGAIGQWFMTTSGATQYQPTETTYYGLSAVHDQDMLVIDSGTYAGTYRLEIDVANDEVNVDSFNVDAGAISSSWRIKPGFDVLSAQVVYDKQSGPRVHIKAVEHPVLLPRNNDL